MEQFSSAPQPMLLQKCQRRLADLLAKELSKTRARQPASVSQILDAKLFCRVAGEVIDRFSNARIKLRLVVSPVLAVAQEKCTLQSIHGEFLVSVVGAVRCDIHFIELHAHLLGNRFLQMQVHHPRSELRPLQPIETVGARQKMRPGLFPIPVVFIQAEFVRGLGPDQHDVVGVAFHLSAREFEVAPTRFVVD